MRKIRAWDKFNEAYFYSENFERLSDFFRQVEMLVAGGNVVVVEESTGLKDKTGREIYEGDLIKVVGAESGEMVVHVDDITMMPLSTLYPAGEVIGNIYENPNLAGG